MKDEIWQKFWELNEKIHEVDKRTIKLETESETEDTCEEDYTESSRFKINAALIGLGIMLSGVVYLILYVIINFHL